MRTMVLSGYINGRPFGRFTAFFTAFAFFFAISLGRGLRGVFLGASITVTSVIFNSCSSHLGNNIGALGGEPRRLFPRSHLTLPHSHCTLYLMVPNKVLGSLSRSRMVTKPNFCPIIPLLCLLVCYSFPLAISY